MQPKGVLARQRDARRCLRKLSSPMASKSPSFRNNPQIIQCPSRNFMYLTLLEALDAEGLDTGPRAAEPGLQSLKPLGFRNC